MLRFETPLVRATLIKRYKRFLSDHLLEDGQKITASCPNTGAMTGAKEPGQHSYLSYDPNSKRKYPYVWQLVECDGALTSINTHLPNKLIHHALERRQIEPFKEYHNIRREVPYAQSSRVDFLLSQTGLSDCYLEVKAVHMSRSKGLAEFPDAVTTRGTKHLNDLSQMREQGHRAALLFVIQRADCTKFQLAHDIDPGYAKALKDAKKVGVAFYAYTCTITPKAIALYRQVPFLHL